MYGHALLAIGYDRAQETFIILNSWGSGFGDNGYFYLPYKWFAPGNTFFNEENDESKVITDDFWIIKTQGSTNSL